MMVWGFTVEWVMSFWVMYGAVRVVFKNYDVSKYEV